MRKTPRVVVIGLIALVAFSLFGLVACSIPASQEWATDGRGLPAVRQDSPDPLPIIDPNADPAKFATDAIGTIVPFLPAPWNFVIGIVGIGVAYVAGARGLRIGKTPKPPTGGAGP